MAMMKEKLLEIKKAFNNFEEFAILK